MGAGEQYLNQRNDKLHQTEEVEKAADKKRRAEERAAQESKESRRSTNYQKPEEKNKAERDRIAHYNAIFRQRREVYEGNVVLNVPQDPESLELPREIQGDLDVRGLQSAEGLNLPEIIGGSLILTNLHYGGGLEMPRKVHGNVDLSRLQNPDGLKLPETIGGHLLLKDLRDAESLEMPRKVHGTLDLSRLQNPNGLKLPETIGGHLLLKDLRDAEGLEMPQQVNGDLNLSGLELEDGLKLPEIIGGYLHLKSLLSAQHLELPRAIRERWRLGLHQLRNVRGVRGLKNVQLKILFSPSIEYVPREVLNMSAILFISLNQKRTYFKMEELYQECDRREYQKDKQRLEEMRSQLHNNKQRALGKRFFEQIGARLIYHWFRFFYLFCKPLLRKIRARLTRKRNQIHSW